MIISKTILDRGIIMKKAIIILTDGFEEMEALVPADILRRAGVDVSLASIGGSDEVIGSHGIKVIADTALTASAADAADMLILPGGPGASAYIQDKTLTDALIRRNAGGGLISAICAAPLTLGKLGLLKSKAATCYPGLKDDLEASVYKPDAVVTDGNITTARAAGASAEFGMALAEILAGPEEAGRVRAAMYL